MARTKSKGQTTIGGTKIATVEIVETIVKDNREELSGFRGRGAIGRRNDRIRALVNEAGYSVSDKIGSDDSLEAIYRGIVPKASAGSAGPRGLDGAAAAKKAARDFLATRGLVKARKIKGVSETAKWTAVIEMIDDLNSSPKVPEGMSLIEFATKLTEAKAIAERNLVNSEE